MNRPNRTWTLALVPAVAIGWLLMERLGVSPEQPDSNNVSPPEASYEAFGRGIRSVIYDEEGFIAYTLTAREQWTFPGQITVLDTPLVQMFEANAERWNISAASGRIQASARGDIQQLDLNDAVQLLHQPSPGQHIRLTTEWLVIEPPSQTMYTDARVRISGIGIEQTAQGLRADMGLSTLSFISDIQGRYYRDSDQTTQ
jgi:LPS export ABC transporter protein LptC